MKLIYLLFFVSSISFGQTSKTISNRALDQDLCLSVNDGGVQDADAVCIDGATGRYGLQNNAPNADLHIGSASAIGDATNPALQFGGTTTYRLGLFTDAEGGYISNQNGDDGIKFSTKNHPSMMVLDANGNMTLGTPNTGTGDRVLILEGGNGSNAEQYIKFNANSVVQGYLISNASEDTIQMWLEDGNDFTVKGNGGIERVRFENGGGVKINDYLDVESLLIGQGAATMKIQGDITSYANITTTPLSLFSGSASNRGTLFFEIVTPDPDRCNFMMFEGLESGVAHRFYVPSPAGNCTITEGAEGVFTISITGYSLSYVLTMDTGNTAATIKTSSGTATGTTYVSVNRFMQGN